MSHSEIPGELQQALAALRKSPGVVLLEPPKWHGVPRKWVFKTRLLVGTPPTTYVPRSTDWYVLVGPRYPWDTVELYPDKTKGISVTFQHQRYNDQGPRDTPWRQGSVCLNGAVSVLGRTALLSEPYSSADRLVWYCERALRWLELAAKGQLAPEGDIFELPEFPGCREAQEAVCFQESGRQSELIADSAGVVEFVTHAGEKRRLFATAFKSHAMTELRRVTWGQWIEALSERESGVFLRLGQVPVLEPWQAPATWSEFRRCCVLQGVDWDAQVARFSPLLRDGKAHVLMVGFGIPARIGGPLVRLHWQAIRLPVLSHGQKTARGFRPNERGYKIRDRSECLRAEAPVKWLQSENWDPDELNIRGKLPDRLREARVLLVGAGALGSALAEMLVRGGVTRLTIADADSLVAGNLVRHTLVLSDVDSNKARGLAQRLRLVSPHLTADVIAAGFPPSAEPERGVTLNNDVVLDCSGDMSVPYALHIFPWTKRMLFCSLSLNLGASRLFVYGERSCALDHQALERLLEPWLQHERRLFQDEEMPREGMGCWHPVFPARCDDVWLLAAAAIKCLAELSANEELAPTVRVFAQKTTGPSFIGMEEIHEPDAC